MATGLAKSTLVNEPKILLLPIVCVGGGSTSIWFKFRVAIRSTFAHLPFALRGFSTDRAAFRFWEAREMK